MAVVVVLVGAVLPERSNKLIVILTTTNGSGTAEFKSHEGEGGES